MLFVHYACPLPSECHGPLGHALKDEAGDSTHRSSWSRYFCLRRPWIQIQSLSTGLHTLMDIQWRLTSTERRVEGRYAGTENPSSLNSPRKRNHRSYSGALRGSSFRVHCSWNFHRPLHATVKVHSILPEDLLTLWLASYPGWKLFCSPLPVTKT